MDGNDTELCDSLIKWLQTLDLRAGPSNRSDLSNGVAIAEVLTQIAPEYFTPTWNSKIKTDVGNNWRLKVSNLKKILEGVVDYHQDVLSLSLQFFDRPDVVKIAENSDASDLGRLLQLVLSCAVNCDKKEAYITKIMDLELSCQRSIMQAIQELENLTLGTNRSNIHLDSNRLPSDVEAREALAQRCHELDSQVKVLKEEKMTLLLENQKLHAQIQEGHTPAIVDEHGDSLGPVLAGTVRYNDMRRQLDSLKDELYKVETVRDDYKAKATAQEREIIFLKNRNEELQGAASETAHLKDEVDALRETADKVANYEATIESYKKRMEEFVDLKKQVRLLEKKNVEYVQRNIEYEEDAKKSNILKGQLDIYKKQVMDLNEKLDAEVTKADKLEIENKKLSTRLLSVQREKDNLLQERDTLKETCEELRCSTLQTGASEDNVSRELIPNDLKERLIRLEHENKLLRESQGNQSDQASVQALLEDYAARLEKQRNAIREANQKIMHLEASLEEAKEPKAAGIHLEEALLAIQEQKQKVNSLQESLSQKDAEILAIEEKYKKCIEKAKEVIKTLDPRTTGQQSLSDVTLLHNRIVGEKSVNTTQSSQASSSKSVGPLPHQDTMKEGEERLLISAFFKLGAICHRGAVDERLALISAGQSFLARQRQPTPRKPLHSFKTK